MGTDLITSSTVSSVRLCVRPSVRLSVRLSVLSVYLCSVRPSVSVLCVRLSVCRSVRLSVRLFVRLSVCSVTTAHHPPGRATVSRQLTVRGRGAGTVATDRPSTFLCGNLRNPEGVKVQVLKKNWYHS